MSDDKIRCGTCFPGCVPKTPAAQRAVCRHRWCDKCQCGRAFYPAVTSEKPTAVKKKDDGKRPCRWPSCSKRVDPAMWGCKTHWFALPAAFRNAILAAYQPGQEDDLTLVSQAWVEADRQARDWVTSGNERRPVG